MSDSDAEKIELVDVVALDLENARLRNENTKLNDIIDRAIIILAEANPLYLAACENGVKIIDKPLDELTIEKKEQSK